LGESYGEGHTIIGRSKVVSTAVEWSKRLHDEIVTSMVGREAEHFYLTLSLFSDMFARLSKADVTYQAKSPSYGVYNEVWLRALSAFTSVLDEILPQFIPIREANVEHAKETMSDGRQIELLQKLLDYGFWLRALQSKSIRAITIKSARPEFNFASEESRILYESYVPKAMKSRELDDWSNWMAIMIKQARISGSTRFQASLRADFAAAYHVDLEDFGILTTYLEELASGDGPWELPEEEWISQFRRFTTNDDSAERLVKLLTFRAAPQTLRMAPLIPREGGRLMLAGWILHPVQLVFDGYMRPLLYNPGTRSGGLYGNLKGRFFEQFVETVVRDSDPGIEFKRDRWSNRKFTVRTHPQIRKFLELMGNVHEFEIDRIFVRGTVAWIVSCKGEDDLPKKMEDRLWAFFPPEEIEARARENANFAKHVNLQAKCAAEILAKDLGLLSCKYAVPALVYPSVQPLSSKEFLLRYGAPKIPIVSPRQLLELITQTDEGSITEIEHYPIKGGSS
jgi:hypothetical protein